MRTYLPRSVSITGVTGQLGRSFLARLADNTPDVELRLLVRSESSAFRSPGFQAILQRFRRVRLVFGDIATLSLTAAEEELLASAEGGLWHFAACTNLRKDQPALTQRSFAVNLDGTRRIVDLCCRHRCRGLYHVSTAFVAGCRSGAITENELDLNAGFRNSYEASKAQAERIVRSATNAGLPVTLFRPSLVVNDRGAPLPRSLPHVFATAFREALRPGRGVLELPLPLSAAINIVPEDFVTAALLDLAALPGSGATYHLTARSSTSLQMITDALAIIAPNLRIAHAPHATSSLLARMLLELRGYWETQVVFDRTCFERDCTVIPEERIDWLRVIEREVCAALL